MGNPGCPRTHSADQVGLKLRDLLDFASQVLGLKAQVTTTPQNLIFLIWKEKQFVY